PHLHLWRDAARDDPDGAVEAQRDGWSKRIRSKDRTHFIHRADLFRGRPSAGIGVTLDEEWPWVGRSDRIGPRRPGQGGVTRRIQLKANLRDVRRSNGTARHRGLPSGVRKMAARSQDA